MHVLFIINDPPYGSERPYQALRLADAMQKIEEDVEITIYLTADGVACGKKNQKTPNGYYNVERMLKLILKNGMVMACKTCLEARGLEKTDLMDEIHVARLGELAQLTLEADKVLVY